MLDFDFATCATQGAREYQEDTALTHVMDLTNGRSSASGSGVGTLAVGGGGAASGGDARADARKPRQLIAVLADGMGGHTGGALASRTVCDTFVANISDHALVERNHLHQALVEANAALARKVEADPVLSGMGSTMIGVSFSTAGVDWVSVGDSPLLLFRRGEIALLNEDHSLAPELDRMAEAGVITAEEALRDPRRHMLRSAVTGDELDLVDQSQASLQLEPGDYVILASDGLQTLEPSELERIISAYADDGAAAVANALIRAVEAVRDPHQDNATVVAVRPLEVDAPASSLRSADDASGAESQFG